MDVVSQPAFLERVQKLGGQLAQRLRNVREKHPRLVVDVRTKGLWGGLALATEAPQLTRRGLQEGVMLNLIGGKVLRFAPPLIIEPEILDRGIDIVDRLLSELDTDATRA